MSRKAGGAWGCKPHNNRRGKEHGLAKSLYSRALRSILIQLQGVSKKPVNDQRIDMESTSFF